MKTIELKTLLIALDYDPTAQKVAETGFLLGKKMGAEIILLHVVSDPVYYSSMEYSPIMGFTGYMELGPVQLDNIESLKKASYNYLEKTKQHLDDKTIKTVVGEGDYADSILSTAKKLGVSMIVMGSHSRKWLENIVMGSVTEKVLHRTTIPLLIVPTKKHLKL